jgi:hypothetical protein
MARVEHPRTYPKRTPPKATKKPMAMAGHALPASLAGLDRDALRNIMMVVDDMPWLAEMIKGMIVYRSSRGEWESRGVI